MNIMVIFWRGWLASPVPSADTIGRVFGTTDTAALTTGMRIMSTDTIQRRSKPSI
jgi:hypothetical protein